MTIKAIMCDSIFDAVSTAEAMAQNAIRLCGKSFVVTDKVIDQLIIDGVSFAHLCNHIVSLSRAK